MPKLTETAIADYNKLVLTANKRLQRLEKLSEQKGYEGVKNWAYRLAMADIKALRGSGATRFPTVSAKSAGMTGREASALLLKMRRAEKAIQSFKELPTSTKSGIERAYKKQAVKFSEGAGVTFNVREMASVFESGLWQALRAAGFSSETTRRIVGVITDNKDALQKLRENGRAMRFSGDVGGYGDRINAWLDENKGAARILGKYLNSL